MNKRNMSTLEASLYTFGVFFVIVLIAAAFGVGDGPKCAYYNCDNEVSHKGDYCYLHNSNSYKSNGYKKRSSTGSSYNSSGSNSSSGNSYNGSGSNSYSHKTSTSSNKKYNSGTSYDDGYDDVYMDDDYDWDRYREDDDYASGVDDALEDMDDGDWSYVKI